MSVWEATKTSTYSGEMMTFYQQRGIFEIRDKFAPWIEKTLGSLFDNNENAENVSDQIALHFLMDLKEHIKQLSPNAQELSQIMTKMNQIAPLNVYAFLADGLMKEIAYGLQTNQLESIYTKIEELIKTCKELNHIPTLEELNAIVKEYEKIQNQLFEHELKSWQKRQTLSSSDSPLNDNLDLIQSCIEHLVTSIFMIFHLIDTMRTQAALEEKLNAIAEKMRQHQEYLILASFIVEKQPKQVLKTNSKYSATVRWLIGPQLGFGDNTPVPQVKCTIVSESQAKNHCIQRKMTGNAPPSSGELQYSVDVSYNAKARLFSANFSNMFVSKIKRSERRGCDSVMDEKFAFLFYTSVVVNGHPMYVWTLSLPVVVTVHASQESHAWATITWDNSFSDIERLPFQVPDRVSWARLSECLDTKFASATGRGLTEDNKRYLYKKVSRCENPMRPDDYITWSQFRKDTHPSYGSTFWDWFFQALKLTNEHLTKPWQDGFVVGFMDKLTAEERLKPHVAGTFLLRFSDSTAGGVSVAYLREDRTVWHIEPWTAKDFCFKGLTERIQDLTVLRFVFPNNTCKDIAFGKPTSRPSPTTNNAGYVPNVIITTVPDDGQHSPPINRCDMPPQGCDTGNQTNCISPDSPEYRIFSPHYSQYMDDGLIDINYLLSPN